MMNNLVVLVALIFVHETSTEWSTLPKTFSKGSPVYGVASANDLVHVIREKSPLIETYDARSLRFTSLPSLNLSSGDGYYDMAYLPHRNMIALLNWFQTSTAILVSLTPPYEITRFQFGSPTYGAIAAAKTDAGDDDLIIITDSANKYVKVYTPLGQLVMEFQLKIAQAPRQAIKLPNNLFAVTFGYAANESHYVCRFNTAGFVIGRCFGGRPGNSTRQVNVPARMVMLSDKSAILLADMKNRRILKLSINLKRAQVILDEKDEINQPYRIYLDEAARVLYVGDNVLDPVTQFAVSGRILAFKY